MSALIEKLTTEGGGESAGMSMVDLNHNVYRLARGLRNENWLII